MAGDDQRVEAQTDWLALLPDKLFDHSTA